MNRIPPNTIPIIETAKAISHQAIAKIAVKNELVIINAVGLPSAVKHPIIEIINAIVDKIAIAIIYYCCYLTQKAKNKRNKLINIIIIETPKNISHQITDTTAPKRK